MIIAGLCVAATVSMLGSAGCGVAGAGQQDFGTGATAETRTFTFIGALNQTYVIPDGTTEVYLTALGGSGGEGNGTTDAGAGATVTGFLNVQPQQQLIISVGQAGADASQKNNDPVGGWNGFASVGGNGNSADDTRRTGGAGGGATTIQLADADGSNAHTVLVAGGGGDSGGASGDTIETGAGGNAGCNGDADSWRGEDGDKGSTLKGGFGGPAGAAPTGNGLRGQGGSGLGGNGGGGGGGVNGGRGGEGASGTSAGGGGGAGSSATYSMHDTAVTCHTGTYASEHKNGQVVVEPVNT